MQTDEQLFSIGHRLPYTIILIRASPPPTVFFGMSKLSCPENQSLYAYGDSKRE